MNNQQREKKGEMGNRRRRRLKVARRNSSAASHNSSAPEEPEEEYEIRTPLHSAQSFPAKAAKESSYASKDTLPNEIQLSQLHAARSFPYEENWQPHGQLHAVRSYPSLAADAFVQVDPTPNTSRIMGTTMSANIAQSPTPNTSRIMGTTMSANIAQSAVSYYSDDGTGVHNHASRVARQHLILLQGNGKTKSMRQQAFLYQAALKGDWKAAEAILQQDTRLASLHITQSGDTALHIAAGTKHTKFVRELVKLMSDQDLALTNHHGNTAFCFAAASGMVEIAKVMYERNHELPTIRGSKEMTPLYMAALLGNKEMVSYLYKVTPLHFLKPNESVALLEATIHIDMFDLALDILSPAGSSGGITLENKGDALPILARKPAAVTRYNQERMWKRLLSITRSLQYIPWMKRIHDDMMNRMGGNKLVHQLLAEMMVLPDHQISKQLIETSILHDAAEVGNVEFLAMVFRLYPELILRPDHDGHTIFHIAVLHRQENVFNLIYDIGAYKDLIVLSKDKKNNNILHLAGKVAAPNRLEAVSGAALQMQRELQWFKEVEKIVPPSYHRMRNNTESKQTPKELFSDSHQPLLREGETWMKDTANSCMLVATLIATMAFAAAFTVPGGNSDNTGVPIFLKAGWFEVFILSNAVAMFTSTTSIIVFLSILTSRYAEDDFLESLPTKLMIGLTALFVSILTMVVAFTASFFLIYNQQKVWMSKLIGAFACVPVTVFALLQYKLWIDTIRSTYYLSRFLFRPSKHKLY